MLTGQAMKTQQVVAAQVKPLRDLVLVKKDPEETHFANSRIEKPDIAKTKPRFGTVLAVGPGKMTEDGVVRIPVGVKKGQRVLLTTYGTYVNGMDDKTLALFPEGELLAVIEDGE